MRKLNLTKWLPGGASWNQASLLQRSLVCTTLFLSVSALWVTLVTTVAVSVTERAMLSARGDDRAVVPTGDVSSLGVAAPKRTTPGAGASTGGTKPNG